MIGTPASIGTGFASDSGNTVVITVSGGGAAVGDLVTVFVGNDGGPNIASGVTDSKGNTYSPCQAGVRLADSYTARLFYSVITTALVNGDTITGTVNGGAAVWDKYAAAMKTSGNWSAGSCLDQTSSGTGSGTAWSSGSTPTTAVADELVIGGAACGGAPGTPVSTPGTNLTEIHDVNAGTWVDYTTVYRIVSATGAYQANGTWTTTDAWGAIVATFKEAGTDLQPTILSSAESADTTAVTNHPINLPGSLVVGEILLLIMAKGSTAATVNAHADWQELLDENVATGFYIGYREVDGTEGATTTLVTNANTRCATIVHRIADADLSTLPEFAAAATGSSTTPNPPNLAPTGGAKNYLWIAAFSRGGEEADDDTWVTAAPANFTGLLQKAGGTGGTNIAGMIAVANREFNAASLDPGTFTAATGAWRAITIAVHPASSVNQTPITVPATLTVTPAIAMRVGRTLAVSSTHTPVLVRTAIKPRTLAATLTATPLISRKMFKAVAAALTATSAISFVRHFSRTIAATVTNTPVISRIRLRPVVANLTLTAALTQRATHFWTLAASTTLGAAISRRLFKPVAASLTTTPAIAVARRFSRTIPAGLTLTTVIDTIYMKGQTLAAGLTLTPVISRLTKRYRNIDVTMTMIPVITPRKTLYRTIAAGLSLVPVLVRQKQAPRTVAAGLTLTAQAQLVKTGRITLAAGFPLSTLVARRVNMTLNSVVNLAGELLAQGENMVPISLGATLNLQVAVAKVEIVRRVLNATLLLDRAISFTLLKPDPDKDWLLDAKGIDEPQLDSATLDEAVLERTVL